MKNATDWPDTVGSVVRYAEWVRDNRMIDPVWRDLASAFIQSERRIQCLQGKRISPRAARWLQYGDGSENSLRNANRDVNQDAKQDDEQDDSTVKRDVDVQAVTLDVGCGILIQNLESLPSKTKLWLRFWKSRN
jgi:hypothetical protein